MNEPSKFNNQTSSDHDKKAATKAASFVLIHLFL
ncbi:hypothetical protein SAMN05428961_10866 [Paenibacillus sp. OK060]|nr:hypothetical protein gpAD87_01210 [Paenibacillus sp. AD87]SDL97773.1 hypothetical protein SAMN05428961_10866 [Paenibacillus sp. OK060]SLK14693.1 hypothetical protein SAMN06272722_10967 [Paenibacillus sp. RU5A]SOC73599.1 hypothetical protein SAMN05880581_10967 [Paenibacillus sp. RU26A]SOC75774.1 hypothetical protein SAMN05880586_10967 [Paenibacillus sp. RU5M]